MTTTFLYGQTPVWEEVVYLKNGSIIRGTIIEQIPNKSLKIQTKDRSVFVYSMDEIEKIAKEEIKTEATPSADNQKSNSKFDNNKVKSKGFSNITEIGGIFGAGNSTFTTYTSAVIKYPNQTNLFSLTTINGYQFNRNAFLGLGVGLETGKTTINFPLFLDVRYYPLKKRVTPVIDLGAGYALNWLRSTRSTRSTTQVSMTKGGALAYSQVGVRIYVSQNVSWIFGLGYRFQQGWSTLPYTDANGMEIGEYVRQQYSHFFTLKTGLTF